MRSLRSKRAPPANEVADTEEAALTPGPSVEAEFARSARDLPYIFYAERASRQFAVGPPLATAARAACGGELLADPACGRASFAGLRLDRDITEITTASGRHYELRTKRGDEPRDYALGPRSIRSPSLLPLTRVRPRRLGADTDALFPGRGGATHHPAALARSISRFMHDRSSTKFRRATCLTEMRSASGWGPSRTKT